METSEAAWEPEEQTSKTDNQTTKNLIQEVLATRVSVKIKDKIVQI